MPEHNVKPTRRMRAGVWAKARIRWGIQTPDINVGVIHLKHALKIVDYKRPEYITYPSDRSKRSDGYISLISSFLPKLRNEPAMTCTQFTPEVLYFYSHYCYIICLFVFFSMAVYPVGYGFV